MDITVAKSAGFCFGVRRAVKMAEEAAEKYGKCLSFGPIIHNSDVVERLSQKGVKIISDISEVNENDAVIIRSHGVGKDIYCELEKKRAIIIDATCPSVSKIHDTVSKEAEEGRTVMIIGEENHPEVIAISKWCGGALVFETAEALENYIKENPEIKNKPVSVVSQTTGVRSNFELSVKFIKKECTNFKIFDTICNATSHRQSEAEILAKKSDAMVVVGGKHSANSRKLSEICREHCGKVIFVENANEFDTKFLNGVNSVGVTAGASTPEWILKEVNRKMSEEIKMATENSQEVVEKAEIVEESANNAEGAESFEELLERSIKTLHTGEKVTGVIAAITQTEVSVDLGTKQSGYIPTAEFSDDPSEKIEDIIKVGDEIEAYVMRVNDVEGTVMLSKKRLDSVKAWEDITAARNDKTVLEGVVVEENKGGIVVSIKGVRVFVPASQSGLPKDAPMTELLKKKVKLRITEVNQPRRRVVGSIRAVEYEERRARAEQVWNDIEVGKRYKGVVKSLTSYGAFVDIGGIDGMVHVSELSWSRIRNAADVLSVGDEIEVYVISFDKESRKISLGYKDRTEEPWAKFTASYEVGSVADVKIVKLMAFGAFAEIVPGVDGLIHISQIADRRIGKPDEVLSEGQTVQAKIVGIDEENHKVSLSIKALIETPAEETEEENAEEANN